MAKLVIIISGRNLVSIIVIVSLENHFENELTQTLQAWHCELGKKSFHFRFTEDFNSI